LEEHVKRLREELDREREERNYFQLERDKVNTFWEIERNKMEQCKSELRNKDREMEDREEKHQTEIKASILHTILPKIFLANFSYTYSHQYSTPVGLFDIAIHPGFKFTFIRSNINDLSVF